MFLFLLLILSAFNLKAFEEVQYFDESYLYSMDVMDSNKVLIANLKISNYISGKEYTEQDILYSENGGKDFETIYHYRVNSFGVNGLPRKEPVLKIKVKFINDSTFLFFGQKLITNYDEPGILQIYYSEDKGKTWDSTYYFDYNIGNKGSTFDFEGNNRLCVGAFIDGEYVMFSQDYGKNWNKFDYPNEEYELKNVQVTTQNEILILSIKNDTSYLIKMDFSGEIIDVSALPEPFKSIHFDNYKFGIAGKKILFDNNYHIQSYITNDSGENWEYVYTSEVPASNWRNVVFGDSVIYKYKNADLYKSTDKGLNWEYKDLGYSMNPIVELSLDDKENAYIILNENFLLKEVISTGIINSNINNLKAYPLPAMNNQAITLEGSFAFSKVDIFSIQGKHINKDNYSINYCKNRIELTTNSLKGIYFVIIKNQNTINYSKIIIE